MPEMKTEPLAMSQMVSCMVGRKENPFFVQAEMYLLTRGGLMSVMRSSGNEKRTSLLPLLSFSGKRSSASLLVL